MATTVKRLTYDDLKLIPQDREGDRHELFDGELAVSPSPAPKHQIIAKNLVFRLEQHIEAGDLGTLIPAPIDVLFDDDTVLIPDVIFIAREQVDAIGDKAIEVAPDLVIEILSPGTRRRDLNAKRAIYARFRVREYWIVDPEARTITVLTLAGERYQALPPGDDGMIRSQVLLELTLAPEAVFKGA